MDMWKATGFKVVTAGYRASYGFDVFRVGTWHTVPDSGEPLAVGARGFHFCDEALQCILHGPYWSHATRGLRLLRVGVPHDATVVSAAHGRHATDRLYVIEELPSSMLSGRVYCNGGRHVVSDGQLVSTERRDEPDPMVWALFAVPALLFVALAKL
jgi:hypothetical protein